MTKPFGTLDYMILIFWVGMAVLFWKGALLHLALSPILFWFVFLKLIDHSGSKYNLWDRFVFLLSFPTLMVLLVFLALNGEADGSDFKAVWGVIWYGDENAFEASDEG